MFQVVHTTIDFFFDTSDKEGVITAKCLSFKHFPEGHTAELRCCMCPELSKCIQSWGYPYTLQKIFGDDKDMLTFKNSIGETVVLVSHPHGLPKMVTFGRFNRFGGPPVTDQITRFPVQEFSSNHNLFVNSQTASYLKNIFQGNCILNFMKTCCNVLSFFGRQSVCPLDDKTSTLVCAYHNAPTCPGSSGGVVLLIGKKIWQDFKDSLSCLPVFLHVGTLVDQALSIAVPLKHPFSLHRYLWNKY